MAAKETPYIPPLLLRRGALWDEGVSMLERHRANNPHSADEEDALKKKLDIKETVVKNLKSELISPFHPDVMHAEFEVEQTLQELHLPQSMGWMVRLVHAGAIAWIGGLLIWLGATYGHIHANGMPAGIWRWVG